jgi:hypothetical protein
VHVTSQVTHDENAVFFFFLFTLSCFGSYVVALVLAESIHVLQRAQVGCGRSLQKSTSTI